MIGRYISPDSIIPDIYDPQSLNRYSYCLNNPLIYLDPSGHFAFYYGLGATAYSGRTFDDYDRVATVSEVSVVTVDHDGIHGDPDIHVTSGSDVTTGNNPCAIGHGAGAGPVIGFFTGNDITGEAENYTLDLGWLGITYTSADGGFGFSIGVGGKGHGLGVYKVPTDTFKLGTGKPGKPDKPDKPNKADKPDKPDLPITPKGPNVPDGSNNNFSDTNEGDVNTGGDFEEDNTLGWY